MEKGNRYWWITMSANGHFRTLKVKSRVPPDGEISNFKWQNCVFFDSESEARAFLAKMEEFIENEYVRAKSQKWFK